MIISQGEAAVIDPLRNIDYYQELIASHHARLLALYDTHNHADRISGGRFLAEATGAPFYKHPYDAIHLVDRLPMRAPYTALSDGDTFSVGSFSLRTIWFPGHTLGMCNFLLTADSGQSFLFSGDGIFIHSIGRPDLMGVGESWAEILYESLTTRLKPFVQADTWLLPAHFQFFSEQNSKNFFARQYAELKEENPYLQPMDVQAFKTLVLKDIPETPEEYLDILRINHALMDVPEERALVLEAGKNLCSATILEH